MTTTTKIVLHKAHTVLDYDGFVLDKAVLAQLKPKNTVRISMVISPDYDRYDRSTFIHDAPYVEIIEVGGDSFLGEVLDQGRVCDEDKYPVRAGERIWFTSENIIEVPAKLQKNSKEIRKYRTKEKVGITGPLYTIVEEPKCYSDPESDSESDPESDHIEEFA